MSTDEPITTKGDANLLPPEEQRYSQSGHNSEQEHFEQALRKQIALNSEREELNARITKARKQMKADGVVLGKLDDTIKKMAWTPAEQREDLAVTLRYMSYVGFSIGSLSVPEGGQVDMYANADDAEVAAADWKSRGRSDALRLKPAKVPKECPLDYAQAYLSGHEEACWWSSAPIGQDPPAEREVNDDGEWIDPDDAAEWTEDQFAEARRIEGVE